MKSIQRAFSPRKKEPTKPDGRRATFLEKDDVINKLQTTEADSTLTEFEAMLSSREAPGHIHPQLRHLSENVKKQLVKNDRKVSCPSPKKRKAVSIRDESSLKRIALNRAPERQIEPEEYANYIKQQYVNEMDRTKSSKLKRLLRNENIGWVKEFMAAGGYEASCSFISQLLQLEWREQQHDFLLADYLSCIKSLHETQDGATKLGKLHDAFLQQLADHFLNSQGIVGFGTRTIVVQILEQFISVSSATSERVGVLLRLLSKAKEAKPETVPFLQSGLIERPYRNWVGEIERVTKDVSWMFMNYENEIPIQSTNSKSLDEESRSANFGPRVGGIEWEVSAYLEAHLRLINQMVASTDNRLRLRQDLLLSGLERILGGKVRKASVALHPGLHTQLRVWVSQASQDNWPHETVAKGTGLPAVLYQQKTNVSKSVETTPPPILDIQIPSLKDNDDFWS